jgi:ferrous-iron efflux pump FieF
MKLLDHHIALKPEDVSHNYGHGKVATLFMGAWAVMLLLAGFQILSRGTGELIILIKGQDPVTPGISAFFAAALSPLSKGFLLRYDEKENGQLYPGGRSPAKYRFLREEIFFSGCVLLGIGCTFLPGRGWAAADSLAAVFLSLLVLKASGRVLYGTADELIEASLDEESNRNIRKIISETEGVISCRGLKTRRIGKDIAINVSISVKDSLNIREAAGISGRVEERLKAAYGEETYTLIKAEPDQGRNCPFRKISRSPEKNREKPNIKKLILIISRN